MHINENRFASVPPSVSGKRSTFDMNQRIKTTANYADLVPFMFREVLPGDTFDVGTQLFARQSTPLHPVMDDSTLEYFYFFIPNRLVWDSWAEFLGENKNSAWVSDFDLPVPSRNVISLPGSVYDHFGVPTYTQEQIDLIRQDHPEFPLTAPPSLSLGFLLPRCFHLTYNDWFRDENIIDPILVNRGDDVSFAEAQGFQTLPKVAKKFDYFTAALPAPQKGDAVDIPLTGGDAPVFAGLPHTQYGSEPVRYRFGNDDSTAYYNTTSTFPVIAPDYVVGDSEVHVARESSLGGRIYESGYMLGTESNLGGLQLTNLYANMDSVNYVSVNQLRQAFAMQRLLELQSRTGTRYTEIIKASFGVTSPDARLQRPEYLGGGKVAVQMQQVTQTSSSDSESPLGHLGAFSKTVSAKGDFSQSFTEHGYIIGVMCARTNHTYQQGLHPAWSRRGRYDFYWPTFANIGEQPVYKRQLFATGGDTDDEPFGYNEAWAEYRYSPDVITGGFRSTVDGNLDTWHYGDFYTEIPTLSKTWIEETPVNVDRTLAVPSSTHDQLLVDILVNCKATRVMPLYSVPGLREFI